MNTGIEQVYLRGTDELSQYFHGPPSDILWNKSGPTTLKASTAKRQMALWYLLTPQGAA